MPEEKVCRDAEVFALYEENKTEQFVGEIFFSNDIKSLTICTPEADYIFTLTATIKK